MLHFPVKVYGGPSSRVHVLLDICESGAAAIKRSRNFMACIADEYVPIISRHGMSESTSTSFSWGIQCNDKTE